MGAYNKPTEFEEIINRVQRAEDLGEGGNQRDLLGSAFKRLAALVMERHYMAGHPSRDAAHHMIEAAHEAAELYLSNEEGEQVIILR